MKILASLFAASLFLSACGGTQETMTTGSGNASAADIEIEVEKLGEHNRKVTVLVKHLPPPDRIAKGMSVFVMWLVAPNSPPAKASIVTYDADDRLGEAFATTPNKQFEIRITAEKSPNVGSPSAHVAVTKQIKF